MSAIVKKYCFTVVAGFLLLGVSTISFISYAQEAESTDIQPLLLEDETMETVDSEPAPDDLQDIEAVTADPIEMPNIPDAPEAEEFDENLFFDAEALVPESEVAKKAAPSKVNPVYSPGSRLVVTRTKHDASSKEARLVAAERAMKLGRYESALDIYNGLYSVNRSDPNVLMGRAVALQRIGHDEEAVQAYEELLDKRPKNVEARVNMYGLMGKRYPAVALRNLIELAQDNPGRADIAAQIAVVHAQMGQYQDAIRSLGAAASMEPENAGHIFNMAVIADRAGEKKQAIQYYEEALELDTLYGAGRSIPRETVFERLAQLR